MRASLTLTAEILTDPGGRPVNGDAVRTRAASNRLERLHSGTIWVIADGVGPDSRGRRASRLAAEAVADAYWHSAIPDIPLRLRAAVEQANDLLFAMSADAPPRSPLACATALACAAVAERAFVAHVGRERAYLWRAGVLHRLTEDHSWVAEQVRRRVLSLEEAAVHPRRNVITRCLGVGATVPIDVTTLTLEAGDYLLLCSDGLHRALDDDQIAAVLARCETGRVATLVEEAKRAGGRDNITAVGVAVSDAHDADTTAFDRLALLNRLGLELTLRQDLDATLDGVLAQFRELTGGERAALLLRGTDGALEARYTHQMALGSDDRSHRVAEEALRSRRPILIRDADDDEGESASESMIAYRLRSVLCVPMIVNDEAIGVLYVDSTAPSVSFEQEDLDLLIPFASHAAAAIRHAQLHQEVVERTRALELARREQDAIVRSLASGLIAIGEDGRVTHWNPAAEQMLGVPAATALGAPLLTVLPPPVATWLSGAIAADDRQHTILGPTQWEGRIGERDRVVLVARVARIRDAGRQRGVAIVLNDRTDVVLMEEARRAESAERQRLRELFGRYLAPPVLEHVLSAPGEVTLGGSRQDVTVLFADVRGFTGFASSHDAEASVAMLNQYLALATDEIFAQLGTLDKFIGDAAMGVFGAPLPLPNNALAGVRAALAMRDRLAELRAASTVPVGFGIGLNSGEAIVGNIGSPQLMSYTAIGDVVNVAARLQQEARAGEILITEATRQRVAELVEVEALGPIYLKGLSAPITTYKVLGLRNTSPGRARDA